MAVAAAAFRFRYGRVLGDGKLGQPASWDHARTLTVFLSLPACAGSEIRPPGKAETPEIE